MFAVKMKTSLEIEMLQSFLRRFPISCNLIVLLTLWQLRGFSTKHQNLEEK